MQQIGFSHITASAVTPEQLVHYVCAVSGRKPELCGGHVAYLHERHAVLVAYPALGAAPADWQNGRQGEGRTEQQTPALTDALESLRGRCTELTVIAPFRPREAPEEAVSQRDDYWQIDLPTRPGGAKLRNMLRRAEREVYVSEEPWSDEHEALVRSYLNTRPLPPGTRALYAALPTYAALQDDASHGVNLCLLSARYRTNHQPGSQPGNQTDSQQGSQTDGQADSAGKAHTGALAAFTLGDMSALSTAFYMFAFRDKAAPPGTADLLLYHLMERAAELGHERMNLGLGINTGVGFFKKKWGARPLLPYVETSWTLDAPARKGGLWSSLTRRLAGK